MLPEQEEQAFNHYCGAGQIPKRPKPRFSGKRQWFILLLLLIALGVIYVALNPWAFFLGGDLHPLGYWEGWGRMHSKKSGDYFLYVTIFPQMHPTVTTTPREQVTGNAVLCTPKGEKFSLRLGGDMPWGYYVNSLGKTINISMTKYGSSPVSRPAFALWGKWGRGELIADDHQTLSLAFLPEGTLRPEQSAAPPSQREDIQVTLHEGTFSEWKAACSITQASRLAEHTPPE